MPTPTKTINFMGIRKVLGTLSICLVVASIILLATRGLNLGLDFTLVGQIRACGRDFIFKLS